MSRIPLIDQSQVNQEIAEIYTELAKTRGGKVPNLFMAMGYSELMLEPAMRVADFVTTESKVSIKHKQLAYLATSRINKSVVHFELKRSVIDNKITYSLLGFENKVFLG